MTSSFLPIVQWCQSVSFLKYLQHYLLIAFWHEECIKVCSCLFQAAPDFQETRPRNYVLSASASAVRTSSLSETPSSTHTYTLLHIQCQYSWDTACHSISWHSVVKRADSVHHEFVIILPWHKSTCFTLVYSTVNEQPHTHHYKQTNHIFFCTLIEQFYYTFIVWSAFWMILSAFFSLLWSALEWGAW